MGAQLLVHAQDGGIRRGAHEEAGGDHDVVVTRLRVDVFDSVYALDDGLERFGDKLYGVFRPQPIGLHEDVDHRHGNLWLLLARQGEQRDEAHGEGGEQEQRRER